MKFVPVYSFFRAFGPFWSLNFIYSFSIKLKCVQGAVCLARSLKVVNEVLTELDLGFNEIRVMNFSFIESLSTSSSIFSCFIFNFACRMMGLLLLLKLSRQMKM